MSNIDQIYDIMDDLMHSQELSTIDFILNHVDLDSFSIDSIDVALSFLTVTLPVKTKLNNRIRLINYIEDNGYNVEELLGGLR